MSRITSFKELKIGQHLTEITSDGDFKVWEVLARDPKLNPDKDLYWKYIYVLDSWGRVEVKRWYEGDLEKYREVYDGLPKKEILDRCIEKAKAHLKALEDKRAKITEQV